MGLCNEYKNKDLEIMKTNPVNLIEEKKKNQTIIQIHMIILKV